MRVETKMKIGDLRPRRFFTYNLIAAQFFVGWDQDVGRYVIASFR